MTDVAGDAVGESFAAHGDALNTSLLLKNVGYQLGPGVIRRFDIALGDGGAAFNVIDEKSAKEGGRSLRMWKPGRSSMHAFGGGTVQTVGSCIMTI